ncbi:MAG: CCA tRNA nucleotidyltransferase [Thalassovita sp.]
MKVTGAWISQPASQAVFRFLRDAGHEAYFVGGCVRNALMGVPVNDLDISTDATPETVMRLATAAGLHAVPTGIDHGTVTVVSDHIQFEITTYRRDVETDGRHAVVAFAKTIEEDARRRDFTMNALYADADGTVVDPLGSGLKDLSQRALRFIEDPDMRIREDYLRILRFFRFSAWYGDPMTGMDPDALAAISSNLAGLETLSRERVGSEVIKLLSAKDPAPALATMQMIGVLTMILPGADHKAIGPLTLAEAQADADPDPICRLAALGGNVEGNDLRLANVQKRDLALFRGEIGSVIGAGELGYRYGYFKAVTILMLRSAMLEHPFSHTDLPVAKAGSDAVFPVKAQDLMPEFSGPTLGKRLKALETSWINSGFEKSKEQLLDE